VLLGWYGSRRRDTDVQAEEAASAWQSLVSQGAEQVLGVLAMYIQATGKSAIGRTDNRPHDSHPGIHL
jgi:hypothetical protein